MAYGSIIGSSHGIPVYSNHCPKTCDHGIHYSHGIYCGEKWQCIEFARRYWIEQYGITFPSVKNACDLIRLKHCTSVKTGKKYNVQQCHNGGHAAPMIGSLLLWSKEMNKRGTGHVAVITGKSKNKIHITQQNETNVHDTLPYYVINHMYYIDSPYLLGWIRL